MILSLDLSSKSTGWAKFTKDGKLDSYGKIIPDSKIDPYFKVHFVAEKVRELFANSDELVIEDIFLGGFNGKFNVDTLKYLARLSGAILYTWIVTKYKVPTFMMAVSARPLVGLKGNSHKAQVQLFVVKKYGNQKKEDIIDFEKKLNLITGQCIITDLKEKAKDYKEGSKKETEILKQVKSAKGKQKSELGKLSELIEEKTGFGEDVSDAIVLNLAYINKIKENHE